MQIASFFRGLFGADPGQQPASNSGWINDALQHQCSVAQTRRFESLQTAKRLLETSETPDWAHSWSTSAAHINEDLRGTLPTIVARATNLARNNEWAQRWLIQQRDNVLGQTGIRLQCRLTKSRSSEQHSEANDAIEKLWREWGAAGTCETSGLSWRQVEALALQSLARTGELFYRFRTGLAAGKFGFQIQVLDPWLIDHTRHENLANGSTVRLGVERDADGRVLAYHLRPGTAAVAADRQGGGLNSMRLSASEARLCFACDEPGQVRGIAWLSVGARRLWMAQKFEEACGVASRNSAERLGFFVSPTGDAPPGFADQIISSVLDAARAAGKVLSPEEVQQLTEAAEKFSTTMPGQYDTIPAGYDFRQYDSPWPNIQAGEYVKSQIRAWSAARGASYHTIGNDLEGVNYSSARVGILDEREHYKVVQQDLIDWLHQPVLEEWMRFAVLRNASLVGSRLRDYIDACTWRPRRWAGIDPAKESKANESDLQYGLTSRSQIILERGEDPEQIARDRKLDEELFGPLPSQSAPTADPADDADDEEDDPAASGAPAAAAENSAPVVRSVRF
ncbi:MAG TPA: phage portal protein [Accumulibacter sp.]|jgi:lambda family phage portal protein|uniref:phage portal protein n=1 Tax=Accumulibacter sp. TaxID=2053492 RepID=UPI002BAFBEEA|nr:phage portal protein [Accumulibacter sp.]HRD87810.1 phage portal protein [Accumulibacter sp.]